MFAHPVGTAEALDSMECSPQTDLRLTQMRSAIAALLFESPQRLDIRYLWTHGRGHFFRVNWWSASVAGGTRVVRSVFLRVEALGDGWRVQELTARGAA
jgi:hypothetical protein